MLCIGEEWKSSWCRVQLHELLVQGQKCQDSLVFSSWLFFAPHAYMLLLLFHLAVLVTA